MANLTLGEARTKVGQFLDDASNVRWTSTQVDDALADALSTCISHYVNEGGDRFDLEFDGTTSATDGSVSFIGVKPAHIQQVAVVVDPTVYRIRRKDKMRRGYTDLTARDLRILYVREYSLPSQAAWPLVGVDADRLQF